MNINKVDAGSAIGWFGEGWRLFKLNPGMWIALVIIYAVIIFVLNFIPIVGPLALALITPALSTGLVYAARELDQGRDLAIDQLFMGLKDPQKRMPMLTLGAIYIGVAIVMMLVMKMLGGGAMLGAMMGGDAGGAAAAGGMGLVVVVGLLLALAIAAAFIFAGPLVMFQNAAPVEALKSSFSACLQNIVPFIVFAVIGAILGIVATIPFLLGWLVLGPVACGAVYASYKAILE